MKLERAQELYSDYAEGSLSPAMRLALEQHFDADSASRADYDDFARAFSLLEAAPRAEVEPPHGFRAKVMEQAAAEQARRAAQPSGLRGLLNGWFLQPRRREAAGALVAAVAIAAAVVTAVRPSAGPTGATPGSIIGPLSLPAVSLSTIRGVDTVQTGETLFHYFRIHLPENVPSAVVNAYVITSPDQILAPDIREQQATPAIKGQPLANDEEMKIPVGLARQAPRGATLNMYVQWKPDNASLAPGAQVVFTPVDVNDGMTPAAAQKGTASFFDSLQSIAGGYHVTVIADATRVPTDSVAVWNPDTGAQDALQTVAASVGYTVDTVSKDTYLVHPK